MNIPWRCIHIKKEFGVRWLKIFYHNSINGDFFSNESQILFSCTNKMLSLFGRISPSFKINGSYEFLLQYPEVEGYNRWKQSVYILDANESDVGYQANPEDISWNGTYWKGMGRSARTEETFIDGSVHLRYWWYAIGAKHNYSSNNRFPGPSTTFESGSTVNEVFLWIRIPKNIALFSNRNHFLFRNSNLLVLI